MTQRLNSHREISLEQNDNNHVFDLSRDQSDDAIRLDQSDNEIPSEQNDNNHVLLNRRGSNEVISSENEVSLDESDMSDNNRLISFVN